MRLLPPLGLLASCLGSPAPVPSDASADADRGWTPTGDPVPVVYSPSTTEVSGAACAFTQGGWGQACSGGNVGCMRDAWFDTLFPDGGLEVGSALPRTYATALAVEEALPSSGPASRGEESTFYGQLTALALNLAFSDGGVYGPGSDLAHATLTGGTYAGSTATEVLALASAVDPRTGAPPLVGSLVTAMTSFNEGFHHCEPSDYPFVDPDLDEDGRPASIDCDDADPRLGRLHYADDFSSDSGALGVTPALDDPWVHEGGAVSNTEGGQQAQLGRVEWGDTVTYVTLRADGAACSGCEAPERFRAGVLARASAAPAQDEGFTGYRCAVAFNEVDDCGPDGPFVQLASFLDGPEDEIGSECEDVCANPTFDQLDRVERTEATDLLAGDSAQLAFWVHGADLVCTFTGVDGETVTTRATDHAFEGGATGLSVLNAMAAFDEIRVCELLAAP